jgi:hypothetical protein
MNACQPGTQLIYEIVYLLYVGEPETPVGFVKSSFVTVPEDLGEVELRRVPAADAVVGPEVPLAFEMVSSGSVPLQSEHKYLLA